MEAGVVELFLVPILLIFMFTDFLNGKMEHWYRLGIPGPQPVILFGNIGDVVLQKKSFLEKIEQFYKKLIFEPYFGIFAYQTPILIINDLNVINNILIDNSKLFNSSKLIINGRINKKSIERSKILEKKLTSEKIKNMFNLIIECTSNQLYDSNLQEIIEKKGINCYKFSGNFTSDVMSFCVFGVDENNFFGENCGLKNVFEGFLGFNERNSCQKKFDMIFGDICDFLRGQNKLNHWKLFGNLIKEKIEKREKRKICRDDFLGILKDLRDENADFELSNSAIADQIFLFIISGYDSSTSLISAVLYELANNLEVQERLRTEIIETLKIYNGELSHDIVNGMEYISMVLNETMRRHPFNPLLKRRLNVKYQMEDTKIYIPKNTRIIIPVSSIHHNEEYYPNPLIFNPERFSKEEIEKRHSMTFLPFNEGPTSSIGEKFALCSAKIALILLLKNFRINLVENRGNNCLNYKKSYVKLAALQ